MKNIKIFKTIDVGESGMPFDLVIDVDYYETDHRVIITYSQEENTPYDNPPDKWYKRVEEIIEAYFDDLLPHKKVIFV